MNSTVPKLIGYDSSSLPEAQFKQLNARRQKGANLQALDGVWHKLFGATPGQVCGLGNVMWDVFVSSELASLLSESMYSSISKQGLCVLPRPAHFSENPP